MANVTFTLRRVEPIHDASPEQVANAVRSIAVSFAQQLTASEREHFTSMSVTELSNIYGRAMAEAIHSELHK